MKQVPLTWAISATGVAVFMGLGMPLPWLLGPTFTCLMAGLAGISLRDLKPFNDAMRAILGGSPSVPPAASLWC